METIIITSMRASAGKTSLTLGIAGALDRSVGYMKPFGDRMLYEKKVLWDYDASLVAAVLGLDREPREMSIAFSHATVRHMYDEAQARDKVREHAQQNGRDRDLLIVEGGRDIIYGSDVHLDAVHLATYLDARLVILVSGNEDVVLDDLTFLRRRIDLSGVRLGGIIINKMNNPDEFRMHAFDRVKALGMPVLGIIPYEEELGFFRLRFLAKRLNAKVITGEKNLDRVVRHTFIGAMSSDAALRSPLFNEECKLIITSGDRGDMILSCLEPNTAGMILSNNILPSATILSRAAQYGMPMMTVQRDTFAVAKQVDDMEPLLMKDDTDRIELLRDRVRRHVDLTALLDN